MMSHKNRDREGQPAFSPPSLRGSRDADCGARVGGTIVLSLVFAVVVLLNGCAGPLSRRARDYHEIGVASWYGPGFHGKKTSNGETYDMYGMTAAHRTLPFGTRLKVTDRKTGRTIDVRVNDRGPFVSDRILDLSYGAAKALGIIGRGTAEVTIDVLSMGESKERFALQIGLFKMPENADQVMVKLKPHHPMVYGEWIETDTGRFRRIRVGPFQSRRDAESARHRLMKKMGGWGDLDPVVIRLNQDL